MSDRLEALGDDRAMVRIALLMPDGTVWMRDWLWGEIEDGAETPRDFLKWGPPKWLRDPLKMWTHPQDPVTFIGTVAPGHEAEAEAVLAT